MKRAGVRAEEPAVGLGAEGTAIAVDLREER